jgi:DNA-binding NarL/FixJ family response regulator
LMDMQMPEMDGIQATRAIRLTGNAVPILAFTANAFEEDVSAALAAGMDGFVSKPVRKPMLIGAIMKCLKAKSENRIGISIAAEAGTRELSVFDPSVLAALSLEVGDEHRS